MKNIHTTAQLKEEIQKSIKEHLIDKKFFSRQVKNVDTINPIKYVYNKRNNKICDALNWAYDKFITMMDDLAENQR